MQVKSIFGYSSRPNPANTAILKLPSLSFPRHDPVYQQLGDLFGPTWTPYFQWRELVMGLCWIFLLLAMKKIGDMNKCAPPQPPTTGLLLAALKAARSLPSCPQELRRSSFSRQNVRRSRDTARARAGSWCTCVPLAR